MIFEYTNINNGQTESFQDLKELKIITNDTTRIVVKYSEDNQSFQKIKTITIESGVSEFSFSKQGYYCVEFLAIYENIIIRIEMNEK